MGNVTEHFSESECFDQNSGRVTSSDRIKFFYLCAMVLEVIREAIGNCAINVNSGKRSVSHNKKIGGAKYSDHLFKDESCAVDITCGDDQRNWEAFHFLRLRLKNSVGQAIAYIDKDDRIRFIHISLPTKKHRGEIMTANYESPRRYKILKDNEGITRP